MIGPVITTCLSDSIAYTGCAAGSFWPAMRRSTPFAGAVGLAFVVFAAAGTGRSSRAAVLSTVLQDTVR
jgi:hypothetical protein